MREENDLEKNENESKDGGIEHSKEQELEVERYVRNFEPRGIGRTSVLLYGEKWRKVCCTEVTCKLVKDVCIA